MNKSGYSGISILELMYDFWYGYIKPTYGMVKKQKLVL